MEDHQRYANLASYLSTGGKPWFLLHCLKTAGTSLIHYLIRLYGRSNCAFHYDDQQSIPLLLESLNNPAERFQHRASHLPLAFMAPYLDQIGADHFHWLACVREPLARQVSLYRYLRARQDQPKLQNIGLDFHSLERFIDGTPRNSQCLFFHPSGRADAALEALDRLGAQVFPLPFLGTVINALYAAEGVPPLAHIHANRSRAAGGDADIGATARAMIAERFQQDQLLYDTCFQRVAPLLAKYHPNRVGVETLSMKDGLERLHSISGPLYIFGASAVARALCAQLDRAGIPISGFIVSQYQGEMWEGYPLWQPDALSPRQWQMATVLIAAETYGPVHRLLSAHGCGRIIDAFDAAQMAGDMTCSVTPPTPSLNGLHPPDRLPAPPGWPAAPARPLARPPAPAPAHRRGEPV